MIIDWIRNHKKQALAIGLGALVILTILVGLIVKLLVPDASHEEPEARASVIVTDVDALYNYFSDYTIGYVLNALNAALVSDQSMANGSPASEKKIPAADATNDELYPTINEGDYTITIKDNKVTDLEDDWGMWETFTITTNDNRSFKVDVAIGAHNRDNDVGYTKISITKL